jgi:hypothetical protein
MASKIPGYAKQLIEAQKLHITDLQKQIERLENLVQTLSDDKFFKPQIIEAPVPQVETESPYELSDFSFQTSSEDDVPDKHQDESVDIDLEFTNLQKQYNDFRENKT